MPSRCAKTGTRASSCTRATRLLPPRGTITSMLPSSPASISPTAARSRVGTSWIASSGRPAARSPSRQRGMNGARRAEAIRAAAQDRRIAGLEAERAGIGGDVRAALVDDADDAERHAHALDGHAVRALPSLQHRADRIVERATTSRPSAIASTRLPSSVEAVEEGGGRAGGLGFGDVVRVGGEDFALRGADRLRHGGQRLVLLRRGASAKTRAADLARWPISGMITSATVSIVLSGAVMASIRRSRAFLSCSPGGGEAGWRMLAAGSCGS